MLRLVLGVSDLPKLLSCIPPRLEEFFYGVHKVWMGDHSHVFRVNTGSSSLLIRELFPITIGPRPWARVEGQLLFGKLLRSET